MPTYCYQSDKTGQIFEEVFPIGQAPREIVVKGKKAIRAYGAESKGIPAASGWPLECVASGVNANQAGELRGFLESRGVPTDVSRDGNPIYRDARHRKKALKARGLFDKSAYV